MLNKTDIEILLYADSYIYNAKHIALYKDHCIMHKEYTKM